jgi:hypothetical protein
MRLSERPSAPHDRSGRARVKRTFSAICEFLTGLTRVEADQADGQYLGNLDDAVAAKIAVVEAF